MPIRYALLSMLIAAALALSAAPRAQITIGSDDLPYELGTNTYTQRFTTNEDGSNTAAIEAILDQDGGDQTYDFTTIDFEEMIEGEGVVESGATGPGAGESPFDQATLTVRSPLVFQDDMGTIEGVGHAYLNLSSSALFDLGYYFEGEVDGMPITITVKNNPDGEQTAAFPYSFGDTWSSSFTEVVEFGGFPVSTDVEQTSEVDGWGTLLAPGVSGGVPVLRVEVTEERTLFGNTTTVTTYEYRSATNLFATISPGGQGEPPTATITTTGAVGTAIDPDASPEGYALEAAAPNPARSETTLAVRLPRPESVRVSVHDVLGREVGVLADGPLPAGRTALSFSAGGLPAGLYVVQLSAGGRTWTRPVTLLP